MISQKLDIIFNQIHFLIISSILFYIYVLCLIQGLWKVYFFNANKNWIIKLYLLNKILQEIILVRSWNLGPIILSMPSPQILFSLLGQEPNVKSTPKISMRKCIEKFNYQYTICRNGNKDDHTIITTTSLLNILEIKCNKRDKQLSRDDFKEDVNIYESCCPFYSNTKFNRKEFASTTIFFVFTGNILYRHRRYPCSALNFLLI